MNKYRAKTKTVDGIKFASQKEALRYASLRLLERAGEIKSLKCHPVFKFEIRGKPLLIRSNGYPNGRAAKYTGDFEYFDMKKHCRVVEDVKSPASKTEAYQLRKALMEAIFNIIVTEV